MINNAKNELNNLTEKQREINHNIENTLNMANQNKVQVICKGELSADQVCPIICGHRFVIGSIQEQQVVMAGIFRCVQPLLASVRLLRMIRAIFWVVAGRRH